MLVKDLIKILNRFDNYTEVAIRTHNSVGYPCLDSVGLVTRVTDYGVEDGVICYKPIITLTGDSDCEETGDE